MIYISSDGAVDWDEFTEEELDALPLRWLYFVHEYGQDKQGPFDTLEEAYKHAESEWRLDSVRIRFVEFCMGKQKNGRYYRSLHIRKQFMLDYGSYVRLGKDVEDDWRIL